MSVYSTSSARTHRLRYHLLPFAIFLGLTAVDSMHPGNAVWMYPIKTLVVGTLLCAFRYTYTEIHPQFSIVSVLVGGSVFGIWIAPEILGLNYPLLDQPSQFNPYANISSRTWLAWWIGFRLLGGAVVVPIMEELFWRSFLIRYLINPKFKQVSIGTFSWFSFIATVLLFGFEHHRWLVGIIAGIAYTLLLYRTKSVFACILAHAVTNLSLGIYVLLTHKWSFWG